MTHVELSVNPTRLDWSFPTHRAPRTLRESDTARGNHQYPNGVTRCKDGSREIYNGTLETDSWVPEWVTLFQDFESALQAGVDVLKGYLSTYLELFFS